MQPSINNSTVELSFFSRRRRQPSAEPTHTGVKRVSIKFAERVSEMKGISLPLAFIIIFPKAHRRKVEKLFSLLDFFSVAFQKHEKNIITSHRFPPRDDVFPPTTTTTTTDCSASMHNTIQLLRWKEISFDEAGLLWE